ncbi:MAG: hypothetical protein V4733_11415 [Verrucomicrobiota bacterium]
MLQPSADEAIVHAGEALSVELDSPRPKETASPHDWLDVRRKSAILPALLN